MKQPAVTAGPAGETKLACPACGSTTLATEETVAARLYTDGIYLAPDGSPDPRWNDTEPDIHWDTSTTVGVACLACAWLYEGPDWVRKLARAVVALVLHGRESTPVPLTGSQTATILVNSRRAIGIDPSGVAGVWPDGETWQRIDTVTEPVALPEVSQPTVVVVEVEPSSPPWVWCTLPAGCQVEVRVSGVLVATVGHTSVIPVPVTAAVGSGRPATTPAPWRAARGSRCGEGS